MHLIIDGYRGDVQRMQDVDFIYQLLDTYPSQIGMTKISPPKVSKYIGSKPEDWGVSAFVLIAESHISIHTFPERSYINIDIFSCKEFDAEQTIRDLQQKFGLAEVRSYILNRGLEYHNDQPSSLVLDSASSW
ncbi:MAG: S-adenosylmethionine decarboxylase proenzyme [Dehalococcoidia bacterium]|nr:MAG: S-adenosylmethionine decarboxylase proenzyme [Dehalococcoidia bacterium]